MAMGTLAFELLHHSTWARHFLSKVFRTQKVKVSALISLGDRL